MQRLLPAPHHSASTRIRLLHNHISHKHIFNQAMSTTTPTIQLYTAATPNGYKASITLEELKAAYGLQYNVNALSFAKNEQKERWFLEINPNGRIPAIVDETRDNFKVFESAALMLYLVQHYDPKLKISFDPVKDPKNYSEALQWIFFVHGGVGPMLGQAGHFLRAAPEKIPYGIGRYVNEAKRLFSVLELRLKSRDYLVGDGTGKYSIADINAFPWVRIHAALGIDDEFVAKEYPGINAWLARIEARPAVYEGLGVPTRGKKATKEEQERLAEDVRNWIAQA